MNGGSSPLASSEGKVKAWVNAGHLSAGGARTPPLSRIIRNNSARKGRIAQVCLTTEPFKRALSYAKET